MSEEIIKLESISQMHENLGLAKPSHPLISLIDASEILIPEEIIGKKLIKEFYVISMKDKSCAMEYGRNSLDFNEGVMTFSAPKQSYKATQPVQKGEIEGWMLVFHPDLIRNTNLATHIEEYSFFNYEVYEALHLSEAEELTINSCVYNIQEEYKQRIDNHSQRVIVSNLELLLNYCLRFYERQFNTRTSKSQDIVSQFEKELKIYFAEEKQLEEGLPQIHYFSEKAHLSQHYFSDVIKKESGRSPKDHINDYVIEKAKSLLMGSNRSVNEIAYDLGFNYPHYFTRLFKSRTGQTPVEYRTIN